MYLLDTNIVSELRKPKPHGGVWAWAHSVPPQMLRVPAIVIYEIQIGANMTRKQDFAKADAIERWLDEIMLTFDVVPFGAEASRETARLMNGRSSDLFEDAMIAATARTNGMTVATRNTRDFERFKVPLINPFFYGRK